MAHLLHFPSCSPYWSSWLIRGYAGMCFKRISDEVFEGKVIEVADLITEEFQKVRPPLCARRVPVGARHTQFETTPETLTRVPHIRMPGTWRVGSMPGT